MIVQFLTTHTHTHTHSLQAFSLIAQFLTLFGGILIGYQRMDSMSSQGTDASDATNANRIGVLVVAINAMTMVWPLVRKVLVGKHVEYYEKVVWMLGFPHRCYMSYCGGEKRAAAARVKADAARAERRRRAESIRRGRRMAVASSREIAGDRDLLSSPDHFQECRDGSMAHATCGDALLGFAEEGRQPNQPAHAVAQEKSEAGLRQVSPIPGAAVHIGTYPALRRVAMQEQSRDLAPSKDHSERDHDKDRAILMILEEILDRMGPEAALQEPVPLSTLRLMLQLHCGIPDLDQEHLRKLFDKCDTNKVHI